MFARVALVVYLIVVALLAFWPVPVDRDLRGLLLQLTDFFGAGGAPWALTYAIIEFTANILLFVPFGGLVTWVSQRWWLGIVLGIAVAVTIEAAQALLLPERFSTLQDVLANSLGAAIGAGLAVLVGVVSRRPRRAEPPSP